MRKMLAVAAVLVLGAALISGAASAHTKGVDDENDVKSPLDLRRVSLSHDDDSLTVMWRTWRRFGPRPFSHGAELSFFSRGVDYSWGFEVTIVRRHGDWLAQFWNMDTNVRRKLPATRPYPRIARVEIPRSLLPESVQEKLQWSARSILTQDTGPSAAATADFAPDDVAYAVHDLTKD